MSHIYINRRQANVTKVIKILMLRSHIGKSAVNAHLSKFGEASVRAATLATVLNGPYYFGAAVKNLWQYPVLTLFVP